MTSNAHFDKVRRRGRCRPCGRLAARYLSAFLIGLGGGLLTFGVTSIVQLVKKQPAFFETLFSVLASLGIGLFLTAVLFPIFYKFGTSKSRILMLLIVALPAVALPLAVEYFPDLGGAIPRGCRPPCPRFLRRRSSRRWRCPSPSPAALSAARPIKAMLRQP